MPTEAPQTKRKTQEDQDDELGLKIHLSGSRDEIELLRGPVVLKLDRSQSCAASSNPPEHAIDIM